MHVQLRAKRIHTCSPLCHTPPSSSRMPIPTLAGGWPVIHRTCPSVWGSQQMASCPKASLVRDAMRSWLLTCFQCRAPNRQRRHVR